MRSSQLTSAITSFCNVNQISHTDLQTFSKVVPIPTGFTFALLDAAGSLDDIGVKVSIYRATKDIMARTLKRKSSSPYKSYVELSQGLASHGLQNQLNKWFSKPITSLSEAAFDEWHHETCEIILPIIQTMYINKNGAGVKYGKAQKIVNMTMKYLYCLNGSNLKEDYFTHCHMPLDSVILKWFKEVMKGNMTVRSNSFMASYMPSWSSIVFDKSMLLNGKYTYSFFVQQIRDIFNNPSISKNSASHIEKHGVSASNAKFIMSLSPLQAEFFIWQLYK